MEKRNATETARVSVLGLRPADLVVFALYALLVCAAIPFHEPWADEAQAWLLARDLSIPSLLFHYLRHEGHPALWYLLLWLPSHLHISYAVMNWLGGAIAIGGVWVLLRFAPIPFYVRALLPFTFFIGYQYSVVGRSYVLFPLLCFLTAHLYRLRPSRPSQMAIVLSLLANVSVHGTIVAVVFACLYLRKLKRDRAQDPAHGPSQRQVRKAAAVFVASLVFVAVCLWPTRGGLPRQGPTLNKILDALSIPEQPAPAPAPPSLQVVPAQPKPPGPVAAPAPIPAAAAKVPGSDRISRIPDVLAAAFASRWMIALLFQGLVIVYLIHRGKASLALAPLALAVFLVFVYSAPWHLGLLWVVVIMILWAAWDDSAHQTPVTLQTIVSIALALLCMGQLPWTLHAFVYDFRSPTSPAKATAAYLHTLPPGTRIAGFGMSNAVQPYFSHNIFFNWPQTFAYLGQDRPAPSIEAVATTHPDVVVAERFQVPAIEAQGYREVRQFCGTLYFPHQSVDPECLVILTPVP